jgi:hypothetical protein
MVNKTLAFFGQQLRGEPTASPAALVETYPELQHIDLQLLFSLIFLNDA